MWVRFILMLQLTRTFGPMLRILISMANDVLKFIFIWGVIIVMITSVASLLFGELPAYAKFTDVLFITFGTGLGSYNLQDFVGLSLGMLFGESFIAFAIIINNIILLNFLVGYSADTYSRLSDESLGIYYDGIISRIPIYEDNPMYGGLIIGTPPFNLLAIFMIPFYLCVKDKKKLKQMNDLFTKLMFAPIALTVTALFMILNIMLLPFAYFAAIVKKIKILTSKNGKN